MPAAETVIEASALRSGEALLDVACGTGNAAALAVAQGAKVSGVDAAERLVMVARERLPTATFTHGDAQALPYADASFDVVVSVLGVIFAADGPRAASEMLRVTRSGGRVVLATWVARGPLAKVRRLARAATASAGRPMTVFALGARLSRSSARAEMEAFRAGHFAGVKEDADAC